jgi:maltooligosyltrehalose synthase
MQAKPHLPLADAWGKAMLSLPDQTPGQFENAFTGKEIHVDEGGRLKLSHIFADFPVAMLVART